MEMIEGKPYRVGYFTDGLKLVESLAKVDTLKALHLKIHMDKSQLRDWPMDQHILNKDYFRFTNISYHLRDLGNTQTELRLKCNYQIKTKINFYGNFWARWILGDFEDRLLDALKRKIERD